LRETTGGNTGTAPASLPHHVLATGKPYDELGEDYFTRRADPERETRRLVQKLEALGHTVSLQPAA